MEYNTTRNYLIMREYGRHIQKMVEYLLTIEDKETRQRNAMAVIELMGTLNPHLRNVEDFRHKLWDHLFLISDFKLEVDSPYPIPTRETLKAKPDRLPYPKKYPSHRHFGKNLELIIEKALKEPDPEKREGFAHCIGNYMKLAYNNWHKENVHDDMVRAELAAITGNQLAITHNYQQASYGGGSTSNDGYRPIKRKNFQHKGNGNNNRNNGKNLSHKHKFNKNRNK